MAIEYKATVTYPAGELTYSFPFLYLRKEFVKATYLNADGTTEDLTYNQDYSIEGQTLTLNEAGESTATIRIYRQTPTDRIIEFVDASILKAYDLNTVDIQLLHIAEENADYCVLNNMVLDEDNAWQGHGHKLKNIADPEDEGDVLTLHYWQNVLDPAWRNNIYTRVAAAATEIANTIYNTVQSSVNAAAASATNAATSALNALTDATAAASSAQAAAASEENAQILVNTVNPPWNVRLNNTAYEVGYLACSAALPSNIRIECITAGTSGTTEPDFSGAVIGGTVTDGTAVWTYRKLVTSENPTGTIISYAGNGALPEGYLLCDGSAVSRELYPELFAVIGTTFGPGDGNTTFNLPNTQFITLSNTVASMVQTEIPVFGNEGTNWYRTFPIQSSYRYIGEDLGTIVATDKPNFSSLYNTILACDTSALQADLSAALQYSSDIKYIIKYE